jgi:hypothetical protein
MVHALRHAHKLLRPGGLLINVQDLPIPHVIEVHSAEVVTKAGWMMESNDFNDERAALNALSQVVSEGNFQLEDEKDFGFKQHFDDVLEFQQWLAEGWETAVLPDKTIQRLEDIFGQADQLAKVVLKTPTRMTRLILGYF